MPFLGFILLDLNFFVKRLFATKFLFLDNLVATRDT